MEVAAIANLVVLSLLITSAASATTKYTNYTVGGTAGWFFNSTTNTTSANYSNWAASLTFNLGDFLIFDTNGNQTVIQTYNQTVYQTCDFDDASDGDAFQYGGGNTTANSLTVAVPLTQEGPNFYFSDAYDGVQCQNGMAFEIQVKHGLGLPPSLNQPPPPPYVAPPSPDSQSPSSPTSTTPSDQQQTYNGGFGFSFSFSPALLLLLLLLSAFVLV
ncbi:cucumber peeling cupredoxin-like [Macadamia integrifolia]|uniref:cucumber peeling cupredoxin-like n=1 Tax=Macadamia integrifolia TaxID=60698 RepID=UPI001C4F6650|nr:cucumber peeling cupredoxin-like [Macadamia integrifolia]